MTFYPQTVPFENNMGRRTEGRTDVGMHGRTDGQTDRKTDTTSCSDKKSQKQKRKKKNKRETKEKTELTEKEVKTIPESETGAKMDARMEEETGAWMDEQEGMDIG